MKNLILILAIAFVAISSNLLAQQEIIWKSHYKLLINKNEEVDPGYIYNAIFTPDDKFIIVSCERRTFLVEAETGKYIRDIKDVAGVIRFSQDGKFIYTYDNKKFNYETGELVGEFLNKGEKSPKFTNMDICEKAGVMIGTTDEMKPTELSKNIWIYDLKTMELLERIGDAYTSYGHLFVNQNALFFQTYGDYYEPSFPPKPKDFKNEFWDIKLRKKMLDAKLKGLGTIETSFDGKWICGVAGYNVTLFNAETYEKKWMDTQGNSGMLSGIAFSPNYRFLATCGSGSTAILNDIHIWDIETGELSYRYSNGRNMLWSQTNLKYSNLGKLILGYHSQGIVVYNAIYTTTNVEPIVFNDTLQVYPNPSKTKVSIKIENNIDLNLKIVNQTGNVIDIESISNLENNKLDIDVSNFANGTYYLVLTQNSISILYKFIKE